jgi:hypothetical protein
VRGPIEASVSVMSELFLSKSGSSSGQTERDHLRWWWWTAQAEAEAGGQAGWQAGRQAGRGHKSISSGGLHGVIEVRWPAAWVHPVLLRVKSAGECVSNQ